MSELIVFPSDDAAFATVLKRVARLVDWSVRLPEWPFLPAVANVDIDIALHDFTAPGYSGPPTAEAGEQLVRTARVRGSLPPTRDAPQ